MKAGFVTCVTLGLECMKSIYAAGGNLELAITLRDDVARDKSGRVWIDDFCSANDIELVKIRNVNARKVIDAVKARELDWLFIIGWSQIAKPSLLAAPRKGVIGIHPTLLPQGRGRAPIPWAIIRGLPKTGVSLFRLDEGVDTGPILAQVELPLAKTETATTLYKRVTQAHKDIIEKAWPQIANDTITLKPQDESEATYWPGRNPDDGQIHPEFTVDNADKFVRGLTRPYPGAFYVGTDGVYRIWRCQKTEPKESEQQVFCISLVDGILYCTDWEKEPLDR